MSMIRWFALPLALLSLQATADINIGVTLSATGPAASLGIPEKNSFSLLPTTLAGQKLNYIILDDASDTTTAVKNARKLIAEHKVDVIIGSTTTPNSLAMVDVVAEAETPMISMASAARIVEPMDDKRKWVFKDAQSDTHMATAIVEHMSNNRVGSIAFIGFADAYGEGWWNEISKLAEVRKIRIGVANSDFLRVGGKDVEGTLLPAGPILVAAQLPDDNPVKKTALEYVSRYEAAYGKGSVTTFGAHTWDAFRLLSQVVPEALKKAQPGSREFRRALRDGLEGVRNLPGAHGVFNMSAQDHIGFDQRARVMVRIENGAWKLAN